jgi:hypothetical protein
MLGRSATQPRDHPTESARVKIIGFRRQLADVVQDKRLSLYAATSAPAASSRSAASSAISPAAPGSQFGALAASRADCASASPMPEAWAIASAQACRCHRSER